MLILKNKTLKKGFSIIEISVVILIIGLLVAGISQGIDLFLDFKINVARSLTKGAPVNRVNGLELWLETTLSESFLKNETLNNSSVSKWFDINPNSMVKKNAQIVNSENQIPRYISKGINNLPSLEFGYNNSYHKLTIPDLKPGNNATFFFVIENHISEFSGLFSSSETSHVFRNKCDASCANGGFSIWNGSTDSTVAQVDLNLLSNKSYIINVEIFNNGTNRGLRIYSNGALVNTDSEINSTAISWNNPYIGTIHYGYSPFRKIFRGKIGEFIVYDKVLHQKERELIEDYLKKKWAIK